MTSTATVSLLGASVRKEHRRRCGEDCRQEKRPGFSPTVRMRDIAQRPPQMVLVLQPMRAHGLGVFPRPKKRSHAKTSLKNGSRMLTNTPEPQTYVAAGVTPRTGLRRGTTVVLIVWVTPRSIGIEHRPFSRRPWCADRFRRKKCLEAPRRSTHMAFAAITVLNKRTLSRPIYRLS